MHLTHKKSILALDRVRRLAMTDLIVVSSISVKPVSSKGPVGALDDAAGTGLAAGTG